MRIENVYPAIARIIVSALTAVELWLLSGVPSVANPMVAFLTIGVIPGTDRRLTPEETYRFIGIAFVVVVCLAFHKELASLFRRKPLSHPGHVYGYVPIRYVSAARKPRRREPADWRIMFQIDRIVVFAVRRNLRKLARNMIEARRMVAAAAVDLRVRRRYARHVG